ncbi:phosphomannomutase/phosphoglucomutase [Chitinimonas arctica]|uniref:Phosphomannomutase/phosphoglucomutase n=1 Tax=Chitinimonas arctica TaxID=2594795 RepID=A0A516SIK2_9NEIS|nr:phosphomannomutase/phosphoglucomutase [Chitinimonas arctica]QDQ27976.1 phosphomannomutase/phosphoglucomutase [Chitinimonas arctica]
MANLPAQIFKAYDIRGIVGKTLDADACRLIGQAIGSEALARKQARLVVGRDGRLSSPALAEALTAGLLAAGVDVIDLGEVSTPLVWFAAHHLATLSGVMITGSHNPAQYNGVKIMLAGETLAGEAITRLRDRIEANDFSEGAGRYGTEDVREAYFERICGDLKLQRRMNIIVDAGNGVAGGIAPVLYRRLGCRVRELFCEVDGRFPHHHPDPAKPENLADLMFALEVTDAELGLAFDGDADRLGVVTKDGTIIYPDRLLMAFAADALSRQPGGKVVYDVKSSRLVAPWVKQHKGKAVMARTGHSYMKAKMKETGALVGGELSGHLYFSERWYGFDDGIYAGARLLEILSQVDDPSALLNRLPQGISTPEIQVDMAEGAAHALLDRLKTSARFPDAEVITLDGLRVEYEDGFGLLRASNTTPALVLRFEGDDAKALKRIQATFRKLLAKEIDGELPF